MPPVCEKLFAKRYRDFFVFQVSLCAKFVQGHLFVFEKYVGQKNSDARYCANDTITSPLALLSSIALARTHNRHHAVGIQALCTLCHPYSAHLYERLNVEGGLTMTNEWCDTFYAECSTQLDLASDYCDEHTGGDSDQYWSYPLVIDGEYEISQLLRGNLGVLGRIGQATCCWKA